MTDTWTFEVIDHVQLAMPPVTPFDPLLDRLAAAGVELRWAEEGPGVRRGHIDDCFGNRLELIDPVGSG